MAEQLTDSKYVVFKTEELLQMMGGFLPMGDVDCAPVAERMTKAIEATMLHDAMVIRSQDVFAGPTLHAYASAVQSTLEIMAIAGVPSGLMTFQVKSLEELRDRFHEAAVVADSVSTKKLPD